jgi:transposase
MLKVMANKPIVMLQIRRILQLVESGCSQRYIAAQLLISRKTIKQYLLRIESCGKSAGELLKQTDSDLSEIVYDARDTPPKDDRYFCLAPRLSGFLKELTRPGVTRYLLWQEYCKEEEHAYSYQQFCEHLTNYKKINNEVMHLEHKPGDKAEVDFAGKMLSYVDKETGEVIYCPVLVAVLPYSGFAYVEALPNAGMEQFVSALNRCMQYFGGVPKHLVSDNMKQFVKVANRYEPSFTQLVEQWSVHYNTTLLAARVAKPRDKATVEKSVDLAYKRIYAPLRDQIFHSLSELNHHVKVFLEKHNHALMQKKDHSRYDLLIKERPSLKDLPEQDFEMKYIVKAKVQKNYHITLGQDWHHYSVPYKYIGKEVKVTYDSRQVEIYLDLNRIAHHVRNYRKHGYSTQDDHMPEKHVHYKQSQGWNEEYFLEKGKSIGENTLLVIKKIIASRQFTEQTYNACLGILRLKEKYGQERLEAASKRALLGSSINYTTISNILSSGMDKLPHIEANILTIPFHDNIRGASNYFDN